MGSILFEHEISDSLRERFETTEGLLLKGNATVLAVYESSAQGNESAGIIFTKHYLTAFGSEIKMFAYEDIELAFWDEGPDNIAVLSLDLSYGEIFRHALHLSERDQRRLKALLSTNFDLQERPDPASVPVRTKMPVSTTPELGRDHRIESFLGPVFGDAIVAGGGLSAARQKALDAMIRQAAALGAHGVIGLQVQNVNVPIGKSMISAMGTAVSLAQSQGPYR